MKIAIMTLPLGRNYGGIMQAWALQQALKGMGHEPVTIDRQPDPKGPAYHAARWGYRALKTAIGKRQAPINFESYLPTITQHTQAFIDQHISMSEILDSTVKLKAHFEREQYDAVIVGSDQTWRPEYSANIENFFLDFLEGTNIKRIAYASSFGVDEWEFTDEKSKRCAALAKRFDAISVREDSGVGLCLEYLGVEARHMLDPTLLLQKEDYLRLIGENRLSAEPQGVCTYFLDKTSEKSEIAKRVSNELGEHVYSCQAKYGIDSNIKGELKDFIMPDVEDWLARFANSKFVLTDSYHGMVFSLIFDKPFMVLGNQKRGIARFKSLESLLDGERVVHDLSEVLLRESFDLKLDGIKSNELHRIARKSLCFLQAQLGEVSDNYKEDISGFAH